MTDNIFILKGEAELVALHAKEYDTEALLQTLLAEHPDLLSGEQIDPESPRRWLLIKREAGIPAEEVGGSRWSVDHLFLDQDGRPTLVEVKRASDTRIRREMVGQMLDYAAHASRFWSAESVRELLATRCSEGKSPDDLLFEAFGFEVDPAAYWNAVDSNLEERRLRLLFVADVVPPELEAVIEFLNRKMPDLEVLGVEIPQYVGEGLRTLVPRVVGRTTEKREGRVPRRIWDKESFMLALEERNPEKAVEVVRRLMKWAKARNLRPTWGTGAKDGSFTPVLDVDGESYWCFSLWTYGRVEFLFQYVANQPGFDDLQSRYELFDRLTELSVFKSISRNEETVRRRPSIPLDALADPGELSKLEEALAWFYDTAAARKGYPDDGRTAK